MAFLSLGGGIALAKPLPRFRVLTRAAGRPVSDGARYLAFSLSRSRVRVLDARTGRALDEAAPTSAATGAPCELRDTGGGLLLWSCDRPVVQDIATRAFEPLVGADRLLGPPPISTDHVGRFWISGLQPSHGAPSRAYLNWHTGELRYDPGVTAYQDHRVVDLNRPSLARRLCAPLRRPSFPSDLFGVQSTVYGPFAYDAPYAVTSVVDGGDLVLERCAQSRRIRLARCRTRTPGACSPAVPGAGRFTWSTPSSITGYVPATNRSFTWSLAAARVPLSRRAGVLQTHTAALIILAYPNNVAVANPTWTIISVPWPDRLARSPSVQLRHHRARLVTTR
jgi:hypothetical protein